MSWSRIGTGLLGLAGLVVAALMGYAALLAGGRSDGVANPAGADLPRVAVFLPNPADWADFQLAVGAGAKRGLLRVVSDAGTGLVVESRRTRRRLRFDQETVRGVNETRQAVANLARQAVPPLAVVGSTTTVLTVALADPLRAVGERGPLLLIPWATAVEVDRPGLADSSRGSGAASRGQIPLVEIDPGRTFRFCPNNQALADSVVDCLIARDGGRLPTRAWLVVDPFDPYSDDLAEGFRRAIRGRKPDVEIIERADAVDLPSFARPRAEDPEPSPTEVQLADLIVRGAEDDRSRATWVVLPLQDQPARRMIVALQRRSAWRRDLATTARPPAAEPSAGPIQIVCGDAIERTALAELARRGGHELAIWCASTTAVRPGTSAVSDDTQALAEIAASLVGALDEAPTAQPTPDAIRQALQRLDLAADDPRAFGRRLAFDASGERRGDPGQVVAILPASTSPVGFVRTTSGLWEPSAARADPPPSSARPGDAP